MRAYDNNNYYGYNNNSMTPSSSSNESQISHGGGGSGGGGQEYLSNVSTTPQSSDAEINYHTSTKLKRPRSDKNQRVSSGSFTIIGSNNNHDDEVQNDSTSYGAKINLQIPTIDTTIPTPQFRIQQAKRSHRKNTSFSIMTELPPTSRTPSPPALSTSGRVSPFRGRGFRPGASSRHTTPSSSPPPPLLPSDSSNNNNITGGMNVQPYYEDQATIRNINYINSSGNDSKQDSSIYRQQSRIPRTNRIDNRKQNEIQDKSLLHTNQFNNAFMNQGVTNSTLNNNSLSRSLSNLPVKPGISRPPPSPRRNGAKQAFTQLSPIIGTPKMSPDTTSPPTKSILKPSKSAFVLLSKDETSSEDSKTKSPSKIPRSTSLNRLSQSIESLSKEPALRENSRNSTIKASQSRLQSRETSPNSKPPTGPRRTVSKNIPKQTTSTAKSTNISRTSSMKNLSKPNSRAPSRSTSPANMQTASGSSPNKLNRLAPKPINRGTSRSRSPSTNPTSRSSSPNKSRKPTTKTTTSRGSNSLHPSRSTSPAVNRATNSTSRGPSPNRLAVPRERTVNRSRDSSPNKNKKPTTKSPTRIPMKSNNNYRNVISKIDSNNKRATNNVTNKPKIPPKPSIDSDNNHKSKTRESRLSRQMSKDKNIGKTNVNEKPKKLLKSSSSKKLISIPGENVTNSETKTSSEAPKNDQAHVSKDNQNNPTTSEDNETETANNNESEDDETRPTPTLATLIAQNFDANANNVVSVTTETATAPLHIDAPKPQIPVAPIENLLSKTVAEKPSIGDVKQSSSSNVLSNNQNKQKNDKTVPSTQEEGSKSPPKPMKNQSNPANMPDSTTGSAPASDRLKQSVEKQNETNVASSNKESNQNIKEESKHLTKKNSEKKIETSNVNNNNTTVIAHSNSVDKNSLSNITNSLQTANNNTKKLPIIVSDKVKPIQIQVKERGTNLDVQSGNIERRPSNGTIAGKGEPRLPSSNATHNADSTTEDENNKKSFCGRIFSCCKFPAFCSKCRKNTSDMDSRPENAKVSRGCLSCCRKTSEDGSVESEPIVADHRRSDASDRSQGHASTNSEQRTCCMKFKDVICCSRKNKVSDLSNRPKGCCGGFSCCRRKSNDENWAERRDSILSDAPPRKCCSGGCWPFCRRKSQDSSTEPDSRRTSMLDKKKSLSPSTIQPPTEKRKPALDESLVEHTSEMRGAIPVLPIPLAWICLILNCILPGVGTILSGIFCLCFGKPRFSVHDGARARLGSFIINLIVGVAQMFCVLFCLVGWGWSIWWGVIMLKVARKHKRTKPIDPDMEENDRVPTATNANHNGPDVERGRS